MRIFHEMRIAVWPLVKTRAILWWWIIKYGGKKHIPPEVIFGALARSVSRMTENVQNAQLVIPDDATEEERQQLRVAQDRAEELERAINRMQWEQERKSQEDEQ